MIHVIDNIAAEVVISPLGRVAVKTRQPSQLR
jgi:hypothetical protein